jgi:xanthine dehydrogenase accessory factor
MDSIDHSVLTTALEWRQEKVIWLITVIRTYGSSPRPVGSMLLIKPDGVFKGSVSGGCIEDDIVDKARNGELSNTNATVLTYGGTREHGRRFGLPCGGTLDILVEPILDFSWVEKSLNLIQQQRVFLRLLDIKTMTVSIEDARRHSQLSFNGSILQTVFGPVWRLIIIGAGETSTYLARMAQALNYQIELCDPRKEFISVWDVPNTKILPGMPDDALQAQQVDGHTAIVALTHDSKLDDMALWEALKSPAFYVGALGSKLTNAKRRERLAQFDLSADEIARLHGPIGINIHSKTPPEIAISILAHIISIKNQLHVVNKENEVACMT